VRNQSSKIELRSAISHIESQALNEQKHNILDRIPESLQEKQEVYGIIIHQLLVKDVTFSKMIQQLFA